MIGIIICCVIMIFQEIIRITKKEEIRASVVLENKMITGSIEEYHTGKIEMNEEVKKRYMEMIKRLEEENKN